MDFIFYAYGLSCRMPPAKRIGRRIENLEHRLALCIARLFHAILSSRGRVHSQRTREVATSTVHSKPAVGGERLASLWAVKVDGKGGVSRRGADGGGVGYVRGKSGASHDRMSLQVAKSILVFTPPRWKRPLQPQPLSASPPRAVWVSGRAYSAAVCLPRSHHPWVSGISLRIREPSNIAEQGNLAIPLT